MAPRTLLLTLSNLLIPIALLVFATGFFPYKPFMPGLAEYEALGWEESLGWSNASVADAPFDRLVFMVVDALRSDFLYAEGSGMSFVQSLIREGTALPFTAHATSPTITMPRVKAITTGSIPSFLDVILNFAESDTSSTLATQDTWLAQLKAKENGKLVMYGDDTWLKLFPEFFERADGTSSFFVSVSASTTPCKYNKKNGIVDFHREQDFTEVDNNVTRHVPGELLNDDWNAMIMHYLGLDHIGHKAGPKSPNMLPKQKEMDDIVQDIYTAIENEDHLANTLFVLCGDHGMNEGGNHGGSAPGETSPALVFMSPKLTKLTQSSEKKSPVGPKEGTEFEYYRLVEQSDVAPTLAGLLGIPVPRNNLGVFIEELLGFWNKRDRIQLLLRNAKQMKKIVAATYPSLDFGDEVWDMEYNQKQCSAPVLSDGQSLACKWQAVVNMMATSTTTHRKIGTYDLRENQIYWFVKAAQETMSSTASNYDVTHLIIGTSLAGLSVILAFFTLPALLPASPQGLAYTLILLLYTILMFASSYVEEEHNFWYWATSAWLFYLFIASSRKQWTSKFFLHPAIMVLVLHRIIRRWNQTGQKFAGADDIVHSLFFSGRSSILLWVLVGATYLDIINRLARHVTRSISSFEGTSGVTYGGPGDDFDANRFMGTLAVLPLGGTAFVFKLAFTTADAPELTVGINEGILTWVAGLGLTGMARMVFGGTVLIGFWITVSEWKRAKGRRKGVNGNGDLAVALFDLLSLFLVTQTKAQNIPLYLLFRIQLFFLSHLTLDPTSITTTTLLLTQTSFFALGNSNAISSIDLSNSYNGVTSYNILAVGALLFISNWAGPIFWSAAGILLLGAHGQVARHIETKELEDRDWVREERMHLERLARQEKEIGARRSGNKKAEGGKMGAWTTHVSLLTLWTGVSLVSVMVACTLLRTHLFIWTVFSPKFLFAAAWGVGGHFFATVGVGGMVWAAGLV